jgi:hypothetical protein
LLSVYSYGVTSPSTPTHPLHHPPLRRSGDTFRPPRLISSSTNHIRRFTEFHFSVAA